MSFHLELDVPDDYAPIISCEFQKLYCTIRTSMFRMTLYAFL